MNSILLQVFGFGFSKSFQRIWVPGVIEKESITATPL